MEAKASFVMGSGRGRKIMLLRDLQKAHHHVVNPTNHQFDFSNAYYSTKLLQNVVKHENHRL